MPLDAVPLLVLFVAVILLCWAAQEAGYRFGQWRHARATDEKESPVSAMIGSILGLLSFLLAFTFGMAASRFDSRKEAVLDEANAVSATFLRAQLLPERQRSEVARLLREYVDVRLRTVDDGDLATGIARSEEIQGQLWAVATKVAESKELDSEIKSLFIQAVNDVVAVHAKRIQAGVRGRIPSTIWIGLCGLALLGMSAMGYQAGLAATRRSPAMAAIIVAFAGVLFLTADLDRSQEGYLNVSQQALIDVQTRMQAGKS
jgi:hypothetical protein